MTDDEIVLWAARHRHCPRFVRMARLRDFLATLLGGPMFADESCLECAAAVPPVPQEDTDA